MAKLPARTAPVAVAPQTAPSVPAVPPVQPVAVQPVPVDAPVSVPGAPVAPAADTTDDEAAEKQARKLPRHPSTWNAEADAGKGAPMKIDAVPADFDPKKYKPLAKKDFNDEAVFYDYAAQRAFAKAQNYEELAKQSRLVGNVADKKNMKKFLSMQERIRELQAEILAATPPELRAGVKATMDAQLAAMAAPVANVAAGTPANISDE